MMARMAAITAKAMARNVFDDPERCIKGSSVDYILLVKGEQEHEHARLQIYCSGLRGRGKAEAERPSDRRATPPWPRTDAWIGEQ